jgi:hypothetical protein
MFAFIYEAFALFLSALLSGPSRLDRRRDY